MHPRFTSKDFLTLPNQSRSSNTQKYKSIKLSSSMHSFNTKKVITETDEISKTQESIVSVSEDLIIKQG